MTDLVAVITNFGGQFVGSVKRPDMAITTKKMGVSRDFPSLVMESGWYECHDHLERDLALWQEGTATAVGVVIFVKLFRPDQRNQIRVLLTISRKLSTGL